MTARSSQFRLPFCRLQENEVASQSLEVDKRLSSRVPEVGELKSPMTKKAATANSICFGPTNNISSSSQFSKTNSTDVSPLQSPFVSAKMANKRDEQEKRSAMISASSSYQQAVERAHADAGVTAMPSSGSSTSQMFRTQSTDVGNPRQGDPEDADEQMSTLPVYLAACLQGGKLGAAYYNCQTRAIRILEDVSDDPSDLRMVKSMIHQIEPTVYIAAFRQDERYLDELKKLCCETNRSTVTPTPSTTDQHEEEEDIDEGESSQRPLLHLVPSTAFSYDDAKSRIGQLLGISSAKNKVSSAAQTLKIAFQLNLDSVNMIRSLGALLKYLDAKRVNVEFEDYSIKTPIESISPFTVERMLDIDECTYTALQIVHPEYHPSVYKAGKGGIKEGLSLLGICLKHCKSSPGKIEFRRWFRRPVMDRSVLNSRLDAVDFFSHDCNFELVASFQSALKGVKCIQTILRRLRCSQMTVGDWGTLTKTVSSLNRIASLLKTRDSRVELLNQVRNMLIHFSDQLIRCAALLDKVVDCEKMPQENRFMAKPGLDEGLDKLKRLYDGLPEFLGGVAKSEFNDIKPYVSNCAVVYLPMLGYLLRCGKQPDWGSTEADADRIPGLELVFITAEDAYYKNPTMHRLEEQLGDVRMQIIDRETSLMLKTQQVLIEHQNAILDAVQHAAKIDCLVALALSARQMDWKRPILVDEDTVIDVEDSRHPLLELTTKQAFLPNPIKSGGDDGRYTKMKVITGPNASGKSIYLKQVGIVCYLAHVGSFVPAKRAVIGPIDRIFTRVHNVDCVLDGMSTFARDLNQVAMALRRASGNSLVIVDEFGKGTIMEVGLSLLSETLSYWLSRPAAECPHVFCASHLYSLIQLLGNRHQMLSYHTMEVTRAGKENEQLIFLYRLQEGTVDCSYAAHTALAVGIPERLVQRAYEVCTCLQTGELIRAKSKRQRKWQDELKRMVQLVERVAAPDGVLSIQAVFAAVDEWTDVQVDTETVHADTDQEKEVDQTKIVTSVTHSPSHSADMRLCRTQNDTSGRSPSARTA